MLTRADVALRIGRSIATVRKMEGTSLHPRVGPNGVRYFDPREVREVAESIKRTGRALPRLVDGLFESGLDRPSAFSVKGLREEHETNLKVQTQHLHAVEAKLIETEKTLERERREHDEWKLHVVHACALVVESVPVRRANEELLEALELLTDAMNGP